MMNNKLQMPASYEALNEKECACVEGGGIVAQICYAFGRMFSGVHWDTWEKESEKLEKEHGSVVSKNGNVYTYSDGYVYTKEGGSSWGFTSLGNFFYGLGDLFNAFYL